MFSGKINQDNKFNKVNESYFEFLTQKEEELVTTLCGEKYSRIQKEYKRYKTGKSTIFTENGTFTHEFVFVRNKESGEVFSPLKDYLGIMPKQHLSEDLMQKMLSKLSFGTYQRISEDIQNSFGFSYSRQHLHTLFKKNEDMSVLPLSEENKDKILMGDGVKTCGHKFETKVLTSLSEEKELTLLKKEVNCNWEELLSGLDLSHYEVFVGDCEAGLKQALLARNVKFQVCHVHAIRVFGYFLWKDQVPKEVRKNLLKYLKPQLYTLQNSTKKFFKDKDVTRLLKRISTTKEKLEELAQKCQEKGYQYSANYLLHNKDYLITAAELAVEKSLIVPWTTNQMERCMREIAYRTKKRGMNWKEAGLQRITNLVLRRYFLPMQERYYKNYFSSTNNSEVKI